MNAAQAVAADREEAADALDAAIVALGVAYTRLQATTRQLDDLVHQDLGRRLELPIILAMGKAGLGQFLERKPIASPVLTPLRQLVEEQHEELAPLGGVDRPPQNS